MATGNPTQIGASVRLFGGVVKQVLPAGDGESPFPSVRLRTGYRLGVTPGAAGPEGLIMEVPGKPSFQNRPKPRFPVKNPHFGHFWGVGGCFLPFSRSF